MNIKAERIEQLIQVVNRNLLLICSGQKDGLVPIDSRRLHRVDAAVYEGDKFAFEMIHFVKSARDDNTDTVSNLWDRNFTKGLETLLVENAVVTDDIERDCFISRVYCWFSEKLAERRELPNTALGRSGLHDLRKSIATMDGPMAMHTLKGLEDYQEPQSTSAALEDGSPPKQDPPEPPTIQVPGNPPEGHPRFGRRQLPVYVKHAYPNLYKEQNGYEQFLPKVKGAEDNYGMMYHKPESEAELAMHELWLARRQQEAFNWKSQQHMNLVMDRYALHKSRLESDSLRRQESNSFMRANSDPRPHSAEETRQPTNARFTGFSRPSSRQKTIPKSMSARSLGYGYAESPNVSPTKILNEPSIDVEDEEAADAVEKTELSMTVKGAGTEENVAVPVPSREGVLKKDKKRVKKTGLAPMRYRFEPMKYEAGSVYMQLSDSDDDDRPERDLKPGGGKGGGKAAAKKGAKAPAAGAVKFKREAPKMRERPVSANQFHTVSSNDSELKVHYRHTNYRRMPLTAKQEAWLEVKESERVKKSDHMASELLEAANAKGDKGKKDGKKEDKGGGKGKKGGGPAEEVKIPCKYKSAADFMSTNFPDFEDDADGDAQGPMRMMQLLECARVIGSMNEFGMEGSVSEKTLRRALLIPQDKPEAVSLENMRQSDLEGLMKNPAPEAYWRKPVYKTAGGGKKGGKKGKKK
jgi:hypothetical protein